MSQSQGVGQPVVKPLLLHALARNWWLLLLRGIAAIAFGVIAMAWPALTLLTLTLIIIYGVFALSDGVITIVAAITGGAAGQRWWLALVGILGIAAGVVTFLWPGLTAVLLLFVIAIWAIAIGIAEIVGAIRLRKEIEGEWLLIFSGIISVLFGVGILVHPAAGAVAIVWVIGLYALIVGWLYIAFAFRLGKHAHA
jgi:uncharacterized membrane protein HdeD (DUF308 family)